MTVQEFTEVDVYSSSSNDIMSRFFLIEISFARRQKRLVYAQAIQM